MLPLPLSLSTSLPCDTCLCIAVCVCFGFSFYYVNYRKLSDVRVERVWASNFFFRVTVAVAIAMSATTPHPPPPSPPPSDWVRFFLCSLISWGRPYELPSCLYICILYGLNRILTLFIGHIATLSRLRNKYTYTIKYISIDTYRFIRLII